MAANDLTIFRNVSLPSSATGGQTLTICEPSVANDGRQVFYTGNLFAARSVDNAATWQYVSPFTTFPQVDGGFCCDQTVIYDRSRDLTVWLLQYSPDPKNGTNTLRMAVKRGIGGNVFDFVHDLRPGRVDPAFASEWFDYNHAALSNNFLYITTNTYSGVTFRRSIVFRIPLDVLAAGSALTYNYFPTSTNESLRCTAGARETMYFGSHNSLSQLRLFTWPESSATVTFNDVPVAPWVRGGYSAPGPDGNDWLGRVKGDVTGGFLSGNAIGFVWTAGPQPGRPAPYVRCVRIDVATKRVIGQPDIWNSSFAYAYPDACPNDAGEIGISLFRGGGALYPTHVVGIFTEATGTWQLADTKRGTNGPRDTKWGDYVACRRHSPDGLTFIASGFTLQGGATETNVEPRYVHFGLEKHAAAVARWEGA